MSITPESSQQSIETVNHNVTTIVLAGGCFWCVEAIFVRVNGVLDVESGYSNGDVGKVALKAPTYESVCAGKGAYAEVVKLEFDSTVITLTEIFEIFFTIHDPTTLNRQGADVGVQYRSGIYITQNSQLKIAKEFIAQLASSSLIVTEVLPVFNYFAAEDSHQDYFARNPTNGYCQMVAAPKIEKFKKLFQRHWRSG